MNNNINNLGEKEKIFILLPSRIGDSIMSLPALLCLKQLIEKNNEKNLDITIVTTNRMTKILESFDFFEIKQGSVPLKISTMLKRPDKFFFLQASSDNIGYFAKKTYGITVPKKRLKYNVELPYLNVKQTQRYIPAKLFDLLRYKHRLSCLSAANFGIIQEIGFSEDQIMESFDFSPKHFELKKAITDWKPNLDNYIVFCMEAAYGSKRDIDRRFSEDDYFSIAEKIHEKYSYKSAFIGINNEIKLPERDYFIDYRKKISMEQLANVFLQSKGYIGNDTGPLHIANLMQKPTLGVYAKTREDSLENYSPIFHSLNYPVVEFPSIDQVFDFCNKI